MIVVGGGAGTGSEEAMQWMDKAEDMIDTEYTEMVEHFAYTRQKRRKRVFTVTSLALTLVSGLSYIIYYLLRGRAHHNRRS